MASKWDRNISALACGPTLHFLLSQWLIKRKRPWVYIIINGFAYKFSSETVAGCKAGSEKLAFHYVAFVLNVRRWEVRVGLGVYFWGG